jgi:hypothetical protein
MDNFATKAEQERREILQEAASRRNCLGSLENTIREINGRYAYQWKLGAGL